MKSLYLLCTLIAFNTAALAQSKFEACKTELARLEKERTTVVMKYINVALSKEPFTPTGEYPTGEAYCRIACAGIDSDYNAAIDMVFAKDLSELNAGELVLKYKHPAKDSCKIKSYIIDTDFMLQDELSGKIQLGKYDDAMVDGVGGLCGQLYSPNGQGAFGRRINFYKVLLSDENVKKIESCPWVKKKIKIDDLYESILKYDDRVDAKENECELVKTLNPVKKPVGLDKIETDSIIPKPGQGSKNGSGASGLPGTPLK